jgi:anthranilate/para-aminobenzoate synthase component I
MTAGAPPSAAALLAALPATVDAAVVRVGPRFVVAAVPDAVRVASGPDALDLLDRLPPGWWAGFLSYELGGAVERVEPRRRPDGSDGEPTLPELVLARFPARLVLDPASGRSELHGHGEARDLLAQAVDVARAGAGAPVSPSLPRWHSSLDRAGFEQRVAMILEHIGAGDCYQVNLTRRLTCEQAADPVGLFSALDR